VRRCFLIDELDRTDEAFEAFLLEILSDYQVTIPELGTIKAEEPPIVIITTNRTREIHDALKRRCLYHWVDYPAADVELEIVRRKVPGCHDELSRQVVAYVQKLRQMDLFKSPGVAETIDWATALTELDRLALDPETVSDTLGTLLKYQDDIARIEGSAGRELLARSEGRPGRRGVMAKLYRNRPCSEQWRRPHRRQHRLFRAGAAQGRHEGRAGSRARRRGGGADCVGVGSREEFYWVLHSVFVKRREDHQVFDQAFKLFWRTRDLVEKMIAMFSPVAMETQRKEKLKAGETRVSQALFEGHEKSRPPEEKPIIDIDARRRVPATKCSGSRILPR
jgi:hypothetical protein